MSTKNESVDTRLRTLEEVIARLIRPIPAKLIDKKPDKSKADYINITTVKDLLDVSCGRGNWQAEVHQMVPIPPNHLGMVVRLSIHILDPDGCPAWIHQDGTGHEVTDDARIYGDPLTNAYAQALRRAAESFGLARELWRRETIGAQLVAKEMIASGTFDELPNIREGQVPTDIKTAAEGPKDVRAVPAGKLDNDILSARDALNKSNEDLTGYAKTKFGQETEWWRRSDEQRQWLLSFLNRKVDSQVAEAS